QVTVNVVARFGDACNIGGDAETLRHKFDVLRRHCEALGRDYERIIRSSNPTIFPLHPGEDAEKATQLARKDIGVSLEDVADMWTIGTPEQIAETMRPRIEAGVNYFIFYVPGVAYDNERLHLLAEQVIPLLQA